MFENMTLNMMKIFLFACLALFVSCTENTMFTLLPSDRTGITFINKLTETDSLNVMSYEYIYNGGGTGVGDLNNDGLTDVVFAGNQVPPRVYLNQGNFSFRDITQNLGRIPDQWYSSVSIADVNGDGWLDIYITSTANDDPSKCKNRLWINNGSIDGSDPEFTEKAEEYGIDDEDPATNAAFFDYDRDGDLDLFILINTVTSRMISNYREKVNDGTAANNDKLYRNEGNGKFTDVTIQAGIIHEGYGLGLAIGDVNRDGWPDIYVSNDFMSNDVFYINRADGTFSNEIDRYMSYQSKSSMGNDMADINNDGNLDVYTLDMMPEHYFKKKQTINGFSYVFYVNDQTYGYEHQYLRNMLHLHNGYINGEMIPFSEVGQMMGIYQTDWSWSALFADYDNDADKDLIVSNGFPRDMTDKDWTRLKVKSAGFYATDNTLIEMAPAVKIPNIAFENTGELSFKKRNDWLPPVPSYSYGASFADFDNDGDLDFVNNNIDDEAFIFRNNTIDRKSNRKANYLKIKLKGGGDNTGAIGAKAEIWCGDVYQYADHFLTRGYASSIDPVIHFGLGDKTSVDSVKITWPSSGNVTIVTNLNANQQVVIDEKDGASSSRNVIFTALKFSKMDSALLYKHEQNDFVDFALAQKIIPHKFSQIGPRMAIGDINTDGQTDLVIGASNVLPTTVFLKNGASFVKTIIKGLSVQKEFSEADIAIFDADNDGDNDLVSVAGGYENEYQDEYRHYLYENSNGEFIRKNLQVPAFSASVVRPCDFNQDSITDVFIGSRIKNGMFPYATYSWLIHNNGNLASDSASKFDLGMVTDAIWTDYDNDGWKDLLVAREWNSIALLRNINGEKLVPGIIPGFEKYQGLWYSLIAGDFDRDGDEDYIAGNIGDNTRFYVSPATPLSLYAFDLDMDGIIDPVISGYWPDEYGRMKEYPVNYLDELWSQSTYFLANFQTYSSFSHTGMDDLMRKGLDKQIRFELNVTTTSSYIIWNEKSGFRWEKLPLKLQVSPIRKMIVCDLNEDNYPDVLLGGNDYTYDVPTGYYDANNGFVLMNKGEGREEGENVFDVLAPSESGLLLHGMLESLLLIEGDTSLVVAGFNRDNAVVYRIKNEK